MQCLRRGLRAGLRVRQRTNCLVANSLPSSMSFHGPSVLRKISRQQASTVKLGVFNARSVSTSGKSQIIASRVKDLHLSVVGLVETWHDGRDTPSLVACATSTQSERQQDLPNTRARRCLSATSRSTSRAARQHYTVHDV